MLDVCRCSTTICFYHIFLCQVPWCSICPCPATITALSTLGHSHAINEVLKYYSSFQLSINHTFIPMSLHDLTGNYPSIPSLTHPSTHRLWMLCLDLSVTLQAVDSLTYIFSVFSQPTVNRTVSIQSQPVLPQNSSCAWIHTRHTKTDWDHGCCLCWQENGKALCLATEPVDT